ncbi:MAG: hypothetical protein AB8B99_25290 [Phormidesmis sp.]
MSEQTHFAQLMDWFATRTRKLFPAGMILCLMATGCESYQIAMEEQNAEKLREKLYPQTLEALTLSLEENLAYRELNVSCGPLSHKKLVSKVMLIPVNKEVVDAAVSHKAVAERFSESKKQELLEKKRRELLKSDKTTFIMVVVNNPKLEYGKDAIYFENISKNLTLTLNGKPYKLTNFTNNLAASLNPGWDSGYIHFDNFRQDYSGGIDAYAVNFGNFKMVCNGEITASQPWALTFDDTDLNFLALIQEGFTSSEIKEKYVVNTFETIQITQKDVDNMIKILFKLVL